MKLPTELRDFYSYSNGLALEDDRTKEPRFLRQIQILPAYVKFARESFAETHQKYARRYLPFIDWENGDSSGYLLDATGAYRPEIFIFLHEHYEYIEEQDINEFLQPFAESLANFFTQSWSADNNAIFTVNIFGHGYAWRKKRGRSGSVENFEIACPASVNWNVSLANECYQ